MIEERTKRRNKIQVIADILEVSKEAMPPTRIGGTANVSQRIFGRTLNGLVNMGFLKKIKRKAYRDRFLYQTTKKGEDVLGLIYQLRDAFGEVW